MKSKCTFPDTVTCPVCGKPWTRQTREIAKQNGRMCPDCRAQQRANTKRGRYLAFTKTKLRGMSAARWRCELRRRLRPDYYADCGEVVR